MRFQARSSVGDKDEGVVDSRDERFRIVDKSPLDMYFANREYEKQFLEQSEDQIVLDNTRMLWLINFVFLLGHVVVTLEASTLENVREAVLGDLVDFSLTLGMIVYLSSLLFFKPRRWLYMPALVVMYVSVVLFRLEPFVDDYSRFVRSCDAQVTLQKGDIRAIIADHDRGISARGRRNCSLLGSTSILTWMTIIFISPHLFPSLKTMFRGTVSWICVLSVCCLKFRPHAGEDIRLLVEQSSGPNFDRDTAYYSKLEATVRVICLAIVQFLLLMKKGLIEKSHRKKFVDGVRQLEASQKMFLILEYMVPVHFIVRMIQSPGGVIAEQYNRASILFINIVDFERHAKRLQPDELLCFLNNYFSMMDAINHSKGVTKIETVSEEYVAAVGVIPEDAAIDARDGHSELLGRLIGAVCEIFNLATEDVQFQMGMHTGSCVAGVIGQKLPRFRLFGDTINTAARMMQKGFPGHLQMGEATKAHLPADVKVTFRGDVEMKGKGMVKTFLLVRPKPLDDISNELAGTSTTSLLPPSPMENAPDLHRSFSAKPEAVSVVTRGSSCPDMGATLSLPAWALTPSFRIGKRQRILSFTSRSGARSFASGASFATKTANSFATKTSLCISAIENMKRFEQALAQVQVSQNLDVPDDKSVTFAKRLWRQVKSQTGMKMERFSVDEEIEWLQWFHDIQVRKKFTSRIERHMLIYSTYALLTIATVFDSDVRQGKDKSGPKHKIWNGTFDLDRFLVLCVSHFLVFLLCVWARIRCEADWFFRNPAGVQRFLLTTVCLVVACMFVIHDLIETEFRFKPKFRIAVGVTSKNASFGTCDFLNSTEFRNDSKREAWMRWKRYRNEADVTKEFYRNDGTQQGKTADDWKRDCKRLIPSDEEYGAKYINITSDDGTEFFRPTEGETFCSMLQSDNKFQWSPDGRNWTTPTFPVSTLGFGSDGVRKRRLNQSFTMSYAQSKVGICFRRLQSAMVEQMFSVKSKNRAFDWKWVFFFWFYFTMGTHSLTENRIRWVFFPLALIICCISVQQYIGTRYDVIDAMIFTYIDCTFFLFISVQSWVTAFELERSSRTRFKAKRSLETTQGRIETILHTLMPSRIIEELRDSGPHAEPKSHAYEKATIAQSDLCGFTKLASSRTPHEVVALIGEIFGIFDELCDEHDVYKVETRGDGYIAGQAGWPLTQRNSPVSVVHFSLDMIRKVHQWSRDVGVVASCRVGVHTGYCIGGIVGTEMQRYHLFGGLMTVLDLVESTSVEGRVQVTSTCRQACLRQMRQENIRPEALVFEPRKELHLSTSKNDIVEYQEVGGPTFLVRRSAILQHHTGGFLGGVRPLT